MEFGKKDVRDGHPKGIRERTIRVTGIRPSGVLFHRVSVRRTNTSCEDLARPIAQRLVYLDAPILAGATAPETSRNAIAKFAETCGQSRRILITRLTLGRGYHGRRPGNIRRIAPHPSRERRWVASTIQITINCVLIMDIAFGNSATRRQALEPPRKPQYQRAVSPSNFPGSRGGANIFNDGNSGMRHLAPPPREQLPQNEGDTHLLGIRKQGMAQAGYATEDLVKEASRQRQLGEFRRRRV